MSKRIAKYLLFGIAWGCTWFVVILTALDLLNPVYGLSFPAGSFTTHALGSMATGIAAATTSIIYTIDRLRTWQQAAIHIVIGLGIFFPIAFSLGWLPAGSTTAIILSVVGTILFFWLIWSGFYFHDKIEAKRLNKKLKERDGE